MYTNDLADIIESLQANIGLEAAFKKKCRFQLAYISLIQAARPAVVDSAILIANKFFKDETSEIELEKARVACWQFLTNINASSDVSTPENCFVRAVICCLYPKPEDDDLHYQLSWFLVLARKVEDHTLALPILVEEFFVI
jgi:hypothetical protein